MTVKDMWLVGTLERLYAPYPRNLFLAQFGNEVPQLVCWDMVVEVALGTPGIEELLEAEVLREFVTEEEAEQAKAGNFGFLLPRDVGV
jgi:hypothetical protein